MVANNEVFLKSLRDTELLGIETPRKHAETYAHFAFETEIHLGNLIFLPVDNLILGIQIWAKVARHETEGYVVKKLGLFPLSGLKEVHKLMKHILKNVGGQEFSPHSFRQIGQLIIVLVNRLKSIILPKVCKMCLNLLIQSFREGFIPSEPHHKGHPVSQRCDTVDTAHLRLIV